MTAAHRDADDRRQGYSPPTDVFTVPLSELLELSGRVAQGPTGTRLLAALEGVSLHTAGELHLVKRKCVAIVGTRQVSAAGAARARRLARELVAAGVVVVSGLAMGVDTEALTAAIEAGGRVIAVIGTPLDQASPAANGPLQERIAREHLLVSQFAPGSRVHPGNFPARNRTMAALSDATAIVEAGETSGTLHQAAECVRLGRWLFLARSLVEDATLTWPKRFAAQPRTVVLTETADILSRI